MSRWVAVFLLFSAITTAAATDLEIRVDERGPARAPAATGPDDYRLPCQHTDHAQPDHTQRAETRQAKLARLWYTDRQIKLTLSEYRKLRQILDAPQSSAGDVAATFLAVQVPKLVCGLVVVCVYLLLVRRILRRLWDWDVRENPYASAIVLAAALISGGIVIYGLVNT